MKQETDAEMDDNLRPHYDLGPLLKGGVRGKYAERYRAAPTSSYLNRTLRAPFQTTAR